MGPTADTRINTAPTDSAEANGSPVDLQQRVVELTERAKALEQRNEELEGLLKLNPFTNLPIRREFDKELARLLERHRSEGNGTLVAVGMLRLDGNYARIRNTRDRSKVLLFKTAQRIGQLTGDHLYQSDRLDEFVFVLTGIRDQASVERIAEQMIQNVSAPHPPPANDVFIGCSIGFALSPTHGSEREELVESADIALDESRRQQRRYVVYDSSMGARYRQRIQIEDELRKAINAGFEQFRLVFQPFVDRNSIMRGVESLIRWDHPELGAISPADFIPLAEENGTIRFISQWSLYHSLRNLREWREAGHEQMYVSVNLSAPQFGQPDLVDRVSGILESLKLEGRHLKLELTEGTVMGDDDEALVRMDELRRIGVQLSIDDFGTGYSSLAYLKRLPIDMLKIDRSFIDDVETNRSNQEIVKAIISMARSISVSSLAEGVENEAQLAFLWEQGLDYVQGYYYSKPVPNSEIASYLARGGNLP